MRNVSDEGRVAFGAPSRVAFALGGPKRGWLYVTDHEQEQRRGRQHSADLVRSDPGASSAATAARPAAKKGGRMSDTLIEQAGATTAGPSATKGLLRWTLPFLRPYRRRWRCSRLLLVSEIVLGALQPWPFAIAIDYVLTPASAAGHKVFPELVRPCMTTISHGSRFALLVIVVVAGVVLQVVNQLVSAYGTQVQVDTGQRMVYDLRGRLFEPPARRSACSHHITTSTADAVYRVDVDAYAIENLVMSGLFPLATSITALTVMFGVLLSMNVTIALLSLTVMPFLYLCLRYYTRTLVNREERVKELEAKLLGRLYETFGAMRLVKSFAREPTSCSATRPPATPR